MDRARRGELAWVALWAGGVVGLSLLPYLASWWLTPDGYAFTGALANHQDYFSYLAKMRQATEGAWLLRLPYASEPHGPAPIFPQYVLLGKLVALTGLAPPVVYHAARALSGLFLLGAGYWFIARVVVSLEARRTAFLLLALGGGLTWLTSFFGYLAADATIPESNTFYSLFSNVHFPLASGLLALVFLVALSSWPELGWRWMALGGAAGGSLALLQPFLMATLATVGLAWSLLLVARGRHIQRPALRPSLLLLVLPPGALLLALAGPLYTDPVLAQWTAQNYTPSPPPWSYLAGYGLLAPLALVGLWLLLRRQDRPSTLRQAQDTAGSGHRGLVTPEGVLLLVVWGCVGALLLYAPVPYQRRLSEGYHIPVSVLAAVGLHGALLAHLGQRAGALARAGAIGFSAVGSLMLAGASVLGAAVVREPFYLPRDDVAALAWLGTGTMATDLVLASPTVGNLIPAWSSARVYWGHPFETMDAAAKQQRAQEFYRAETLPAARCDFLREVGISLVYAGPLERRLGDWDPATQPGLAAAFRSGPVAIYRVASCAQVAVGAVAAQGSPGG
ncbi:MAG: hypothetical protein HYY02_02930 [Chloroflexi bacterium]|nr:hypothetical protein [Chloroflexota bacterium]